MGGGGGTQIIFDGGVPHETWNGVLRADYKHNLKI